MTARSARLLTFVLLGTVAATTAPTTAPSPSLKLFADSTVTTLPRISVEVVGTGPDLVLIPGLNCSREVWRHTAERLRTTHRLHLVQVAGFAGEPPRANATGPVVEPVIEAIAGYLRDAKLAGKVPVIGHSLGGTMALALAERHPAEVSKVMLVDALPFYGVLVGGPAATVDTVRPTAEAFRGQMATADPARTRATIAQMVTAPADVDRVVGWGAAGDRAVGAQATYDDLTLDLRPGLAATTVPVTLLYPFDAKSSPFPVVAVDALYQGQFAPVPHRTLTRIDDARHFIMYDQPARFDVAVDAFLNH